jgi:Pretoxin HINT domain
VRATDPQSNQSTQSRDRQVTHAIRTEHDTQYVDLTIRDGNGKEQTLTATANHPFWSVTRQDWVDAGKLKPGELLQTSAGTYVQIGAIRQYRTEQTTYDLTVDDVHTYYVVADDTSVLVHNTNPAIPQPPGVIYLRRDLNGIVKDDYVGQAESWERYEGRQLEHAADHPRSKFKFYVLDRGYPGTDLDVKEESWIRAGGGPSTKSNPQKSPYRLSNGRYQMNDADYRAAGGNVCKT